ncbi:MAG: Hsp20/alpha crystallin family protein [Gemmatimonadota bacterium]|nr:MAG: Hsp20/alpha crystallin family protein [Gemmatimonadota bacterium]
MTLVRWRPARDVFQFRDEMDRLFEDFIQRFPARRDLGDRMWNPDVDVHETDHEVVVEAEVPGMEQKDIHVTIKDNILTLKGEKKQEKEVKEADYHSVERSYGSFARTFALPTLVVADKASAKYENGVLKITLPKAEEVKPKEVAVEVK